MNICICDDDEKEREIIRGICEKYFEEKDELCELWEAESAAVVLESKGDIDLLILDIEMPEMDGVTLKNRLQRSGEGMLVLFVTSHEELMPEAFGIHVIGFLCKDSLNIKLPRYLGLATTLIGKNVLIAGKYPSKQVSKIHSEREYCNLFLENGSTILLRSSLKEMEQLLQEADFCKVNRSWLINLRYVERIERRAVWISEERLTVSRGNCEGFGKAYSEFCERNARYF